MLVRKCAAIMQNNFRTETETKVLNYAQNNSIAGWLNDCCTRVVKHKVEYIQTPWAGRPALQGWPGSKINSLIRLFGQNPQPWPALGVVLHMRTPNFKSGTL